MGFGYKQRECETCGGPLVSVGDTGEYRCTYCGNRYERTESYDGQFSVRHAAHQVLSALSNRNFELAEENLNDCNKIDPAYPGSVAAAIAYHIEQARFSDDQGTRQNEIAQAISFYKKLARPFEAESPNCEIEADFYDNLDSADARSVLINTYKLLKDERRMSFLREDLRPESIHSEKAAVDMLKCAAAEGEFAQIDALLRSSATVDPYLLFAFVLDTYPACDQKLENVRMIMERPFNPGGFRTALSDYLVRSQDDVSCKVSLLEQCAARGVAARGDAVAFLIGQADEQARARIAAALGKLLQSDEDVDQILEACCSHALPDEMRLFVEALAASGSFLAFSQDSMMSLFMRADLATEDKIACFKLAAEHGLTEKRKQSVFAAILLARMNPDEKLTLVAALGEAMTGINPLTAERYLMECESDGEKKPAVVSVLFSCIEAKGSLEYAANRYASSNKDSLEVHQAVVQQLAREGFVKTAQNLDGILSAGDVAYAVDAARDMKEVGVKLAPNLLQDYLEKSLGTAEYSSRLFAELASAESRISPDVFIRFLFEAPDEEGKATKVKTLYGALVRDLKGYRTRIAVSAGEVEASVFHSYLVGNHDGPKTVEAVARLLLATVDKPNGEVSFNGSSMKFKKLLQKGAVPLPESSRPFCSSLRLV